MMKTLDDWNDNKSISENIRDINLRQMDASVLSYTEDLVYKAIVAHPGGICDKHIQRYIKDTYDVYLPISSINGRRNGLIKKGLVQGIGSDHIADHNGDSRLNTLWGVTSL